MDASWLTGRCAWRVYWAKAWKLPRLRAPCMTCRPPTMTTATKTRLPRKLPTGLIEPDSACARKLAW